MNKNEFKICSICLFTKNKKIKSFSYPIGEKKIRKSENQKEPPLREALFGQSLLCFFSVFLSFNFYCVPFSKLKILIIGSGISVCLCRNRKRVESLCKISILSLSLNALDVSAERVLTGNYGSLAAFLCCGDSNGDVMMVLLILPAAVFMTTSPAFCRQIFQ